MKSVECIPSERVESLPAVRSTGPYWQAQNWKAHNNGECGSSGPRASILESSKDPSSLATWHGAMTMGVIHSRADQHLPDLAQGGRNRS
jgi:hypothetical protein